MPSGLRVSRIDKVPGQGPLELLVNGVAVGRLANRSSFELTVGAGDILLEVIVGRQPLAALLDVAVGCTARVQIGRRRNLGITEASHFLHVEPMVVGLPDRTRFPLNLSALSALEWLQQKRAMAEALSGVQLTYLQSRLLAAEEAPPSPADVPSLRELGAFAALGLDTDATEADVRGAFRLLLSIHTPETGGPNETMQRLEEAYRMAMAVLTRRRLRRGVSEIGR
ncbi:MAG: hypothetical protein VKO19_07835 [Cyanobacteriota bacterium]|nr:hypothetical protein [Cyanobacteriota bacterium]